MFHIAGECGVAHQLCVAGLSQRLEVVRQHARRRHLCVVQETWDDPGTSGEGHPDRTTDE